MTDDQILDHELPHWPGVTITIDRTGRHRKTVLAFNEHTRFVISPKTRSDSVRGSFNFRADVRRMCKELGATRV